MNEKSNNNGLGPQSKGSTPNGWILRHLVLYETLGRLYRHLDVFANHGRIVYVIFFRYLMSKVNKPHIRVSFFSSTLVWQS